jgi:hypothetical protein
MNQPSTGQIENLIATAKETKASRVIVEGYPHLRELAGDLANLYVEAHHDNKAKLTKTFLMLRQHTPAVIGLILGEAIEREILKDSQASGYCLRCGEQKDSTGKCPSCKY